MEEKPDAQLLQPGIMATFRHSAARKTCNTRQWKKSLKNSLIWAPRLRPGHVGGNAVGSRGWAKPIGAYVRKPGAKRAPRLKHGCYRVLPGQHEAEIAAADDDCAASK